MDLEIFEDERFDFEALDSEPKLGRRQFLIAGLATGAAATALPNYAAMARNRRIPVAKSGTFPLGVASGFPYPKGTILWTQLGGVKRTSRLKLQVAKDANFKNVVLEKTVTARKERDFTARTRVRHLEPSREYFYRFHTKDKGSPVGRFRTAPPHNSNQPLRIAFLSCQSFEAGFFNAHAAIAKERRHRPRPASRRLHLRVSLLRRPAQGHQRVQPRRERRVPAGVPAEVPALQGRPRPAGDARGTQLRLGLG